MINHFSASKPAARPCCYLLVNECNYVGSGIIKREASPQERTLTEHCKVAHSASQRPITIFDPIDVVVDVDDRRPVTGASSVTDRRT